MRSASASGRRSPLVRALVDRGRNRGAATAPPGLATAGHCAGQPPNVPVAVGLRRRLLTRAPASAGQPGSPAAPPGPDLRWQERPMARRRGRWPKTAAARAAPPAAARTRRQRRPGSGARTTGQSAWAGQAPQLTADRKEEADQSRATIPVALPERSTGRDRYQASRGSPLVRPIPSWHVPAVRRAGSPSQGNVRISANRPGCAVCGRASS